ncbi:MAG: hypothetical protein M0P59_03410 [Gallionella sp.]|jgi:hypothetical protein|nr:hypothetical protein [Gallionella sp.]MCK9353187.1 hypothetical protein [Gallionella sp.]
MTEAGRVVRRAAEGEHTVGPRPAQRVWRDTCAFSGLHLAKRKGDAGKQVERRKPVGMPTGLQQQAALARLKAPHLY